MCFIVIYLFYVFFLLVFFNFSVFFLLYFVQRDIGDCAECRCRVWQLFHMCYLSVPVCVCEWVYERVFVSVPIVCLCETNSFFLRASLKFLETRPLRMFSNYKQFQCSSSARKWQIVAIVIVSFFIYFIFCIAKQKLHPYTRNYHRVSEQWVKRVNQNNYRYDEWK